MTVRAWLGAVLLGSLAFHSGPPVPSSSGAVAAAQAAPARDRHVALISIDGFADFLLDDPSLAVPTLRGLIARGVVAESLIPVNPTVTWPNHTTLVTGVGPDRHTVLYNGWAVRGGEGAPVKVEARVEKTTLVRGATVYGVAHAAGLTTAEVDWVAIERAPTITWSFSEFAGPEGAVEREMVAAGLVTSQELAAFRKAPITWRDEIWTRAAEHIVRRHRPNLLLFHLLTSDSVQHTYGTRGLAARTALELADARVARLVAAYRDAGLLDRTTFVIVSDHGFRNARRTIRPNALFARAGLGGAAWAISEGGTAMIYVTRSAGRAETVATLTSLLKGLEGVAQVLTPAEFRPLGYPDPAADPRMADLVVAAADGYKFDGAATGEAVVDVGPTGSPGTHGYLNTDPEMRAIFVASGAGVKAGSVIGEVRSQDVAPTIARLLGLELPGANGRAITEALSLESRAGSLAARDGGAPMSMTPQPPQSSTSTADAVATFNAAINAHDLAALARTLDEACVFENTAPAPDGTRYEGKAAVLAFWEKWFASNPDGRFEVEEAFAAGDRYLVRWVYRKTRDGRPWHLRGIDLFTVRNGLVVEKLAYVKG